MLRLIEKCLRDETGGEVLEYALLVGLVVIGCIGLMGALGVKVVHRWEQIIENI